MLHFLIPCVHSNSHQVSRSQAKVGDDGCESEEVSGAVVFVDPAAELLQSNWSPLELLGKGNQQQ